MTIDEVKAWLRSYRWLQAEIDRTEEEIEQWRARSARLTQSFSGMPSGSGSSDQIPNAVEKITELEEMLNRKIHSLTEKRIAIEKAIVSLPDKQRLALHYYYIEGMTWEEVREKLQHEDVRQVHRIHGAALLNLRKMSL